MKKIEQQNSRRRFIKLVTIGSAFVYSPIVLGQNFSINLSKAKKINDLKNEFLLACKKGDIDGVKKMLSLNEELLNAKNNEGRSAFTIALLSRHKIIANLLKDSGYVTDLHESVLDLNWSRYNDLMDDDKVTDKTNFIHPMGGSVMWAGAVAGAGSDLWRIYSNCGNPNLDKKSGTTPLQEALSYPDLKIAELTAATLLSNNADPQAFLSEKNPPLHIAAERGSVEMVEMLIRLGADPTTKNEKGITAIQLADYYGQEATWRLLNNHREISRTCRSSRESFDINGNKYVKPDMSHLSCHMQGSIVGLAHRDFENLKKKVDKDSRMAHAVATTSEMSIEAGAHMGRKDIVEYLLEKGAPYSLPTAVMLNDFETVNKLLIEDPDRVNERGAHDFPLLWYPIIGDDNIDMMQLLLDKGAKIENQHFLGTTALHWACYRSPIELIELLVNNGADVNRVGRKFSPKGLTPLQSTKNKKVLEYLISKGAK